MAVEVTREDKTVDERGKEVIADRTDRLEAGDALRIYGLGAGWIYRAI